MKEKEDYILSLNKDEYMKITGIKKILNKEYFYEALISEDHFSQNFKNLINGYWECIDQFSIPLADDIEDEIKKYELRLKKNNIKIFDIEIKDKKISFFTKYPTSRGFLEDYPS